jgi:hypothetical protein
VDAASRAVEQKAANRESGARVTLVRTDRAGAEQSCHRGGSGSVFSIEDAARAETDKVICDHIGDGPGAVRGGSVPRQLAQRTSDHSKLIIGVLEAEVTAQRQGNKVERVNCERDSQGGYISGAVRDVLVSSIHITLRTLNLLVREIGHSVDEQLAKIGELGVTERAPAGSEEFLLGRGVDIAERDDEAPERAPRLRSQMGAVQVERPALRSARSDEVSEREDNEATESLVSGEVRIGRQ